MTEICLCIRIHTPAMLANYRFMNINHHHNYFDEEKQRDRILKLYSETFVPFFEILKNQSVNTEKKFKTGISVSGISLSYFKRFVPQFIDLLNELKEENIIEFLSESYSNSSVTSGYTRATIRQIALHNVVMKSLFDVVPETFLTSSPVISNDIFTTIFGCGKKSIFSYSNHFEQNNNSNWHDENFLSDNYREFLINYKASQLLQQISYKPYLKKVKFTASYDTQKFLKKLNDSHPQVVVYNLGQSDVPFLTGNSTLWNMFLSKLIENPEIRFLFPSELNNSDSRMYSENNFSEKTQNSYKHPDIWLKNSLQKDTYSRLLSIHQLVNLAGMDSMHKEWDLLQDMEYLHYMDHRFSEKKYTRMHFSPYSSPYLAYINYMNVLDDFRQRLVNLKPEKIEKVYDKEG